MKDYQIFHKPTKTIQAVAVIDFNNKVVDTYGIDEPIYGVPFADVEWREYTGVKDKNGKEIYEGDIIKSTIDEINEEWTVEISPYTGIQSPRGLAFDNSWIEHEIIGNIYENQELLNEK